MGIVIKHSAERLAFEGAFDAAVHRHVAAAGRIVDAEPEDAVGTIAAHLGDERPGRLLGGRRTLIPVLQRIRCAV